MERKSKENNDKTVVDREGDKLKRMQVGRQTEGSKRRKWALLIRKYLFIQFLSLIVTI